MYYPQRLLLRNGHKGYRIDFYIYLEPCARAPEKRAGISPSLVHDWGKFEAAGLSTNTVASQYLHEAFRAL